MGRGFTGRHMAVGMIAFFGVVLAVNLLMATAASSTFGGTVVDNSYVASQRFNAWLEEADAAGRLGWTADIGRAEGRVAIVLRDHGGPLKGASIAAVARHPLGRLEDIPLHFGEKAPGQYQSAEPLPSGRWQVRLDIRHRARHTRLMGDIAA